MHATRLHQLRLLAKLRKTKFLHSEYSRVFVAVEGSQPIASPPDKVGGVGLFSPCIVYSAHIFRDC